jgi:hypothetical protein
MVLRHLFINSFIPGIIPPVGDEPEETPVKLDGVRCADFRALLKVMYPDLCVIYFIFHVFRSHKVIHRSPKAKELSLDEWEAVFRLSMKWCLAPFYTLASKKLTLLMPPLKSIILGREYNNKTWLREGLFQLTLRGEPLSVEEFRLLGLQSSLGLSQKLRRPHRWSNRFSFTFTPSKPPIPRTHQRQPSTGEEVVNRVFKNELSKPPETCTLDHVGRLLVAREHHVHEWLRACYVELAERWEDITLEEAERLGLETTAALCRAREELKPQTPYLMFDLSKEVQNILEEMDQGQGYDWSFGSSSSPICTTKEPVSEVAESTKKRGRAETVDSTTSS